MIVAAVVLAALEGLLLSIRIELPTCPAVPATVEPDERVVFKH